MLKDLTPEARINGRLAQPRRALRAQHRAHALAFDPRAHIRALRIDTQTAAVRRERLHIKEPQPLTLQDALYRVKREIRVVLMIDGVELRLLKERLQVRELERHHPRWLEQEAEACDEVIDVGHMGEDVIAEREVHAAAQELDAPWASGPGEDPNRLHEQLKIVMQDLVGIFRTDADLGAALAQLGELRRRWSSVRVSGSRAYNPSWDLVFELRNMLIVSEAVTRAARMRTESRGAHSRLDHPATDSGWQRRSVVVTARGGEMRVETTHTVPIPEALQALLVGASGQEGRA